MIIRFIMAASLALSFLTTAAVGEAAASDRFRLFADCGPIGLIVEKFPEAAKKNRTYQGIDPSRWREPPAVRASLQCSS